MTIEDTWYNNLKDDDTFYTKVTALDIINHLDANSGRLHALDMIALQKKIMQYYGQADGIPQYIIMLKDAQKKAKRAGMPIADIELVMMALSAVLAAWHFVQDVDDWEGLPPVARTWSAWKTEFRSAHLKRQRQILAMSGAEPMGGAHGHGVFQPVGRNMGHLKTALDNLALAVLTDFLILQQLTAANLALTTMNAMLTATNKALVGAAIKARAEAGAGGPLAGTNGNKKPPNPNGYCWTHVHKVYGTHSSATCGTKAEGHCTEATKTNTLGGSETNKVWDVAKA